MVQAEAEAMKAGETTRAEVKMLEQKQARKKQPIREETDIRYRKRTRNLQDSRCHRIRKVSCGKLGSS